MNQDPYGSPAGGFDSVIKGWSFCATLQLRTPLATLLHHGEQVPPESPRPSYGPDWAGVWLPVTKSWAELLGRATNVKTDQPLEEVSSQIGPIPGDGGKFLVFLKEYRAVIESNDSVAERVAAVQRLVEDPRFSDIVDQLAPSVAVDWAVEDLQHALDLGPATATGLFEAGFLESSSVRTATDEQLLAVPRLGPRTLASIRNRLGN